MSTTTRGVRKVSENILSGGRAIIVTEKDKNKYKWSDIPVGSKFIDSKTGIEWVKLEGESDWVPAHVKNDGTLCIAKDAILAVEVFTIKNLDDGNGKFTYETADGQLRHLPKTDEGYVFELEKGTYAIARDHLEVYIDDVLRRTASTGGVIELSNRRFILQDNLKVGQEITASYYKIFRIGNPYPRIFINQNDPEESETGDIWIDTDATLAENDYLGEGDFETNKMLPWDRISGKPTTTAEYRIYDEIKGMVDQHRVDASMIDNLPKLPDRIDAYSVQGKVPGTQPNNLFVVPADGRIPNSMMPINTPDRSEIPDIRIGTTTPSNPVEGKTVWFCTVAGDTCVKAYVGGRWLKFGAVWS